MSVFTPFKTDEKPVKVHYKEYIRSEDEPASDEKADEETKTTTSSEAEEKVTSPEEATPSAPANS